MPNSLDSLNLLDVEALGLVLRGSSVIDWRRLAFTRQEEVDAFLKLCQFDPDSPADQAWMRGVIADAASYLRETFRYQVPLEVAQPQQIQDLFLFASNQGAPRLRKVSCVLLKLCHVIHHIEGRDLFHRLPLAEEAFGAMANERVQAALEKIKASGVPIQAAYSSAKSRASLISKLLQKAETLAAEVYDRTRFRVIVAEREQILPVLHQLTQRLFPFHLVVPGQTHNSLIDFKKTFEAIQVSSDMREKSSNNPFSGATYRMLKFVVDMPLRIDDSLISSEIRAATRARTVHCLVEFQIVDAATATQNEQNDNDHERYKRRQKLRILRRLSRGL